MQISKSWTTIIESIVVTLIVAIWVVWVLNIFSNSQKLSTNSKNRFEAIAIAREWIEWLTNMRDTNWMNFQANIDDCWNTINYDSNCITWWASQIATWSYIMYKNTDNRWYLSQINVPWDYSSWTYRNAFEVKLDNEWFYTQSWWVTQIKPLFTREIIISYLPTTPALQKMKVTSLVWWADSSSTKNQKVKLETILTNWKRKN